MKDIIKIGDRIRSLDFPKFNKATEGIEACFIEGRVLQENIDPIFETGPYFLVEVTRRVWEGKDCDVAEDRIQYCPMPHAIGSNGKLLNATTKL